MTAWHLPDREAMLALGGAVAHCLKHGDVLLLEGDLGAGKTTLAQGILAALMETPESVTSPTFTMLQTYPIILKNGRRGEAWHYDLYRVKHAAELEELALEDALQQALVLIEWPDRLAALPPGAIRLSVYFSQDGKGRNVALHVPPAKHHDWKHCYGLTSFA
jgi:tRNA threonylcarbamoyl adenosine modification protein YjeE